MSTLKQQFIEKMIKDSLQLEQERLYYSAFDKLVRGLEAQFNQYEDASQGAKATMYFLKYIKNREVWDSIVDVYVDLCDAIDQFASGVLTDEEGAYLNRIVRNFRYSVEKVRTKQVARTLSDLARALSNLVLYIRNQRFHGHPKYSSLFSPPDVEFDADGRLFHFLSYLTPIMRVFLQKGLED